MNNLEEPPQHELVTYRFHKRHTNYKIMIIMICDSKNTKHTWSEYFWIRDQKFMEYHSHHIDQAAAVSLWQSSSLLYIIRFRFGIDYKSHYDQMYFLQITNKKLKSLHFLWDLFRWSRSARLRNGTDTVNGFLYFIGFIIWFA